MEITSTDNAQIKEYIKLSKHKKYRDETGLFVLEGERLVFDMIKSGVAPVKIFCIDKFSESFSDAFIITDIIADKMSTQPSSQGIFAICRKPVPENSLGDKVIVLAGLSDPGNIGTIIRTADAMGITDIIAADTADIYSPKCTRAAMGSLFHVNIHETKKPFELLSGYTTYAAIVGEGTDIRQVNFPQKSAIIIGNEAHGIPEEIASQAGMHVTINMTGNAESLNAAAAAAILIWELRRET
ncbi:MAG: RNA methyltransferase [Ruminococcus sp.]|jgi:TrmH family RNA methyltransferase|nr:RNA methyltransferase [Ruminococcus sp.]